MCETPQGVRYIVDAAQLAEQLDNVREMLLGGAVALPGAIERLRVLSYALTHPNAPTFAIPDADWAPTRDIPADRISELWRGTPAPSARPALRVVNDG